ncbi:MAG: hypothetical protein IPN77_15415 [Sandaracinaceae bacterium]|nr:hypothetical protein [Sandaracinaceae bacterium]
MPPFTTGALVAAAAPGALPTLWNADERLDRLPRGLPSFCKTADAGYVADEGSST